MTTDTTPKEADRVALAAEAMNLASVLRGMVECGPAPDDLWERDQPDGDPFVVRAAELLEALASLPSQAPPAVEAQELIAEHMRLVDALIAAEIRYGLCRSNEIRDLAEKRNDIRAAVEASARRLSRADSDA